MPADADHLAVLQHHDPVGLDDGRDPLGDDHDGRVPGDRLERGPQARVRGQVQGREGVVEQVDLRVVDERPGDRQALGLAAGDVRAALGDRRLQPFRQCGDEVLGLGDLQRPPELLVGGVRVAVAQVAGDGAGEQERLLRHDRDPAPEQVEVELADVHAVHQDLPPGDVEQPRDQVQQRRLAGAGAADDRGGLPGQGGEGDVAQHRGLRARVLELHAAQLDRAPPGRRGHGRGRVGDRRLGAEHLADPLGADRRPGHHHHHEGGHHHRHQDLHQVGQERRQCADLQLAAVDPPGAEPEHRDAGGVEDQHHGREDQRLQPADPQRGLGQVVVGPVEPDRLVRLAHERPDHPDPGQLLAQHPVHRVDPHLHGPEVRHHPADDQTDHADHQRHRDEHQPGQFDVLAQRHHHSADAHDRGGDQHGAGDHDQHLDLLDVVRGPGDQGRRPELRDLLAGEPVDLAEDGGAQVPAEAHRGLGTGVDRRDRADDLDRGDEQHPPADPQDVVGVAGGDPLVDDVGVQARQVERRHRADQLQDDHHAQQPLVRLQLVAEQTDQHQCPPSSVVRSAG